METKNQTSDPLRQIKETFSPAEVEKNLANAIDLIKAICEERQYVVEGYLHSIPQHVLENSSRASRKKLARRIYFVMKNKSRRSICSLLSYMRRAFLGEEFKAVVKPSVLEQQIIDLRKKYKALRQECESVRVEFREKKKMFYPQGK